MDPTRRVAGRGRGRGLIQPDSDDEEELGLVGRGRGLIRRDPVVQPVAALEVVRDVGGDQAQPAAAQEDRDLTYQELHARYADSDDEAPPPAREEVIEEPVQPMTPLETMARMLAISRVTGGELPISMEGPDTPGAARGRSRGRGLPIDFFGGNMSGGSSSSAHRTSVRPIASMVEPTIPEGRVTPIECFEDVVEAPEASTVAEAPPSPPRPVKVKKDPVVKRGDKGNSTQVACNFMRLNYKGEGRIREYNVQFTPLIDSTSMKRKTLDQFADKLGVRNFDGMVLFLADLLPNDITIFNGVHPGDPTIDVTVTVTYIKRKESDELIPFFNILFKKIMRSLGRVILRRSYYNLTKIMPLTQHKLEIWPGHCIAIEEREGGLMICLEASHRILRTETVHDYFVTLKMAKSSNWKEAFIEFIVGKIVLTKYKNMCYKIDDVIWDWNPRSEFERKHPRTLVVETLTYAEYYRREYGLEIVDLEQPLLLSRIKPRRGEIVQEDKMVALIPELCFVTGLTDDQRGNFTLMKELGDKTRLAPHERRINLEQFVKNIQDTPAAEKILTEWNLVLDKTPMNIQARIIAGPKLDFGRGAVMVKPDFTREATQSCIEPIALQNFLVICTQRDAEKVRNFLDVYRQVATALNIKTIGASTVVTMKGMLVNDFRKALKDNLTNKYQFAIVVMPQQRDDVYGLIKKICVTELAIPSQCILTKTLSNEKRLRSVVQKVALQINCKLGGSLWSLTIPSPDAIMFVGIDVSHDPLRKNPSVLALVINLNNQCTKYFSVVRLQKVHQETGDSLQTAFTEALEEYRANAGKYPDRIVVWRDGGSTSGLDFFEHEYDQMLSAVKKFNIAPKFSFVVIQKRIAQRFFQTDMRGDNWKNPDPGTIIDHTVTNRYLFDFYVVSQLVRQGTVTPTHYIVAYDNASTSPDLMQKLAYALSYMYYNWPGTVRVPAVTQYGHKLSALIGQHVKAAPGTALTRTLYYL